MSNLQTRRGGTLSGLWGGLYPDLLQPVAVRGGGSLHLLLPGAELRRSGLRWPGLGGPGLRPAGPAGGADGVEGGAVDDLLEGGGGGPALLAANWLSGGVAVLGRASGEGVLVALHVPGGAEKDKVIQVLPSFTFNDYLGLGLNLSSEGPMGPVSAPDLLMSPRSWPS